MLNRTLFKLRMYLAVGIRVKHDDAANEWKFEFNKLQITISDILWYVHMELDQMLKSYVINGKPLDELRKIILRDLDGCMITKIYSNWTFMNVRLSQIPVWTDKTTAILKLQVDNNTDNPLPVYSRDLKGDDVYIPYKNICIVILEPRQSINVDMLVEHGTPKQHVLFRLVSSCVVKGDSISIEPIGTRDADTIIDNALKLL
jgi:hypothetical protein